MARGPHRARARAGAGFVVATLIAIGASATRADTAIVSESASGGSRGEPRPVWATPTPRFLGVDDDPVLADLCAARIVRLEPLRRGTTIKFKAWLEGGRRAMVRPAQRLVQGNFRADLAAYALSRALGLGMVPPACERSLTRRQLLRAADPRLRRRLVRELRWDRGGRTVAASALAWVPEVVSAGLELDRDRWLPLLRQRAGLDDATPASTIDAAQASALIAWDFVIGNWDRWSGDNTFRAGASGPTIWLDNAAGFGVLAGRMWRRQLGAMLGLERHSRTLIEALRAATPDALRAALIPTGLSARAIDDVLRRRQLLLDRVAQLADQFGEDAVLAFE